VPRRPVRHDDRHRAQRRHPAPGELRRHFLPGGLRAFAAAARDPRALSPRAEAGRAPRVRLHPFRRLAVRPRARRGALRPPGLAVVRVRPRRWPRGACDHCRLPRRAFGRTKAITRRFWILLAVLVLLFCAQGARMAVSMLTWDDESGYLVLGDL